MVHPLFGPEVRLMLQENDTAMMKTFCETLHPATVAEALAGEHDVEEAWRVLQATSIKTQAAIFEYFPIDWQVKMVEGTGRQHMARLIEQMSHDDRADLLRRLMPRVTESLLRLVDEADRRDIAALVKYPENSAGALMTTDYAWLPAGISVTEALDRLRLQAPDRETIYYIYVLDDQRKLLGVVSLRDLILAPRHTVIRDLMEKEVVAVRVTDDREHVAKEIGRYDLLAIPVVDEEQRMVGIITYDDVIDVVVQEATEDVHRMGGVAPMEENYLEANFATIWRKRAFWLACLFGAELFTFTALSHFEEAIAEVVVLSLFVPLCISTGGNSGSQAATLITRAIALGQLSVAGWFKVLRHELFMGLALGLTLGVIGFVRGAATPDEVRKNPTVRRESFKITVPRSAEVKDEQQRDEALKQLRAAHLITEEEQKQGLPGGVIYQLAGGKLVIRENKHEAELPPELVQQITEQHRVSVSWPDDESLQTDSSNPDSLTFTFPQKCTLRHEAVNRWKLAAVISMAVAAICLWGTLVGSMLPLLFKWRGIDPGIASSPFVATFVDVTGIIIYFSIAILWLL